MKQKLKIFFTSLLLVISISTLNAQMYSETKKTEVKVNKKQVPEKDSTRFRKVPGFIFSITGALNRGVTSGNYLISYQYDLSQTGYIKNEYAVKNSFGYRAGVGLALQGKKFAMELPLTFCVDRFQIPEISTTDHLNIMSFEIGLNQYFKILKEKHYILLGEYIAFADWSVNSLGINLGYGYNIFKRLNLSLRYQFNIFSLFKTEPMITVYKGDSRDVYAYMDNNRYNTLQIVAKYDLVHGVSHKKYKNKKVPKKSDNDYEYLNSQNSYTPPPTKPAVDYSGYSDSDLNLALKEANSKSDLDAMLGIQKELDKRKQADEFSKYSYVQLEQELNKALDKEDYKRADMIKKEMAKRDTQKGMPSENKGDSLESKSIEELTKLKDEAVKNEDYDKAKQIQDIINKKKP